MAFHLAAITIALLCCGTARADWTDSQVQLELSTLHDVAHDTMAPPPAREHVVGGTRLHGFFGGRRFGYQMGLDLGTGVTLRPGGVAYAISLFPIGVALRFDKTSFIALGAGVGANGAFGTLDGAATLPVEARIELGDGVRVLGRARATHLAGADVRQSGAVSTSLADELDAMLGVRVGSDNDDQGYLEGWGYFVGITYREALGARFVGVAVGYSGHTATPRGDYQDREHDPEDAEEDCSGDVD